MGHTLPTHDGDTQPIPIRQEDQPTNVGKQAAVQAETAQSAKPRRQPQHGFLSFILWLITAASIVVMAMREVPSDLASISIIPLAVSFVPWIAFVSLAVLLLALLWHRRVLAVVSILCLALQLFWHFGFIKPTTTISAQAETAVANSTLNTTDKYARIMTLNTRTGLANVNEIVQTVKEQHVEVLALQEMSQGFIQRLTAAGIYTVLPHSVIASTKHGDNGGVNGLWSAASMSSKNPNLITVEASSIPAASITLGTTIVRFGSVHPNSPTRGKQSVWSSGLDSISSLKNYDHTYVLMGDYNSTWDHSSFRSLLGNRFVDSSQQAGEGFHMTYPANSKLPAVIEIDHIVHDKGVVVGDMETVEIAGSDHKALLATLEATKD
jgi:endonuclease/exonuclease/phosphatase (EEP) superfamily protein YafD